MSNRVQHVFGPVPSRRLGRSLGVDLVPYKTCTYDCVYCQLGRTTACRLDRSRYVSNSVVLRELETKLRSGALPDYITLSGSGEPTLRLGLGGLILAIRRLTACPIAVLTNGSLLWREDVQTELRSADVVIPSLDAGDEDTFRRVNRPHPALDFERIVEGLTTFARRFTGRLWLEVFLLKGITTGEDALERIHRLIERIGPDRVQINTVARPPCDAGAQQATIEELNRAAAVFGTGAEVISEHASEHEDVVSGVRRGDVVGLLRRRPCTVDDVAVGLGVHRLAAAKELERLLREEVVQTRKMGADVYYEEAHGLVDSQPERGRRR